MKKRVTIEDVARASHVSVATVSLVMRGRTGINIETRKRVEQVARTLGYQRRTMQHEHRIHRISVLMRRFDAVGGESDPLLTNVLNGIEHIGRLRGIHDDVRYVTMNAHGVPASPLFLPQYEYDGVISVGVRADEQLSKQLHAHALPLVAVEFDAATYQASDTVTVDYHLAVEELIRYLTTLGHRSIGVIDERVPSVKWQHAIHQSLLAYGVQVLPVQLSNATSADVQHVLQELIQQHTDISAIVCRTNQIAAQVVTQLPLFGKFVPQHISVVGFDGVGDSGLNTTMLTTVRIDAHALGALAVQSLIQRIELPNMPRMVTTIDATLMIRQSTQACQPHQY